ncbi:MAG: hypothetical protein JSS87_01860 [Acidobacteria bacterium]|nr:hypothetical protein [Acidobacteriota bacterium]
MKVLIDNLDGQGFVDYAAALAEPSPLRIERVLNKPSTCRMSLYLQDGGMNAPVARGRVVVIAENGAGLFSGYVTSVVPQDDSVGAWTNVVALSDEALADAAGERSGFRVLDGTLAEQMQRVAQQQGAGLMDASGVVAPQGVSIAQQSSGATFSENAGALAEAGYTAYRVLGGAVSVQAIGAAVHALDDVVSTVWKSAPAAVNDVTVSGEEEPSTYVTEVFRGDGATAEFVLAHAPFHASEGVVVDDAFAGAALDARVWAETDPVGCMDAGGAGLVLSGGDGVDGHTALVANDDVELGGALLAEASGVLLSGASDGILCGMYADGLSVAQCVTGIRIRQSGGVTVAFALVQGVETGDAFPVQEGHRYTFRVRMQASEVHRVRQTYRVQVDGSTFSFGGGEVPSPMRVVCDVQDLGLASNTAATVLCDAEIASAPAVARFAAVSAAQMSGSVRRVRLLRTPAAWLRMRDADGVERPGLIGVAGEGVDASLSGNGVLTFFNGRVPAVGEDVLVTYRVAARSVGRAENADAIAAGDALGLPGRAQWRGRVRRPVTRTSEDCEHAAAALVAVASHAGGGVQGVCTAVNPQRNADVWPGDAMALATGERAVVRRVAIRDTNSLPEALVFEIGFANEWAEALAIETTDGLSEDAHLPVAVATDANAPVANVSALKVVAVTESAIQVDAGVDPPAGGGFEVRRWDAGFGAAAGTDADLVLRSAVRGFDIPRAMQQEMVFVRMYDGPAPRRYSRFSNAVRVTVRVRGCDESP